MDQMQIIALLIIMAIIAGTSFVWYPVLLFMIYSTGIMDARATDEELINISKTLPEVKAFLAKYPNATTYVERPYYLVQHSIAKSVLEGHPIDRSNDTAVREDSYLSIWVDIGTRSLNVQQISLLCQGGDIIPDRDGTGYRRGNFFQITSGIESYLQQGKEERCFR